MKLFLLILATLSLLSAQGVGPSRKPLWAPILPPQVKKSKQLEPGKFVYYDPEIEEYVIRYIPLNKSEPVIDVLRTPNRASAEFNADFEPLGDGPNRPVRYTWRTRNLPLSQEPINTISFVVPASDSALACDKTSYGLIFIQPPEAGMAARQITTPDAPFQLSLGASRFILFHLKTTPPNGPNSTLLTPGAPPVQISCTSTYLPGWISVLYVAGDYTSPGPNIPPEALDQLGSMRKIEHDFASGVTFGPKYPPGSPVNVIAMDFLNGIANFTATTQLSPDSAYVRAVKEQLTLLAQGAKGRVSLTTPPSTSLERELDKVLKLALPAAFR